MIRFLSLAATILMIADPVSAHDWYTDKRTNDPGHKGWSCCNGTETGGDCKPVEAWTTPDGNWQFRYVDGKVYDVPEYAMHPDNENPEPFQASACVHNGAVLCFWRKAAGG